MLKTNNDKAIEIAKNKIRNWREGQFAINDIKLQNALADGDDVAKQAAIERRDYLRDLPSECEGKTVEELTTIMKGLNIIEE